MRNNWVLVITAAIVCILLYTFFTIEEKTEKETALYDQMNVEDLFLYVREDSLLANINTVYPSNLYPSLKINKSSSNQLILQYNKERDYILLHEKANDIDISVNKIIEETDYVKQEGANVEIKLPKMKKDNIIYIKCPSIILSKVLSEIL